ncbi:hypothetical protein [Streptomyces flavochromogenes]|uniref:hypothetical protein n=1 Tax=Streptomyces flavochromogenes TaxID=68199 RepID=UPI0004C20D77|nr:hypothetical protein [Streptomyces flavochromogenes]
MDEAQERNTAGAEKLERERIRRFGLALDKLALDPDEAGRIDALNAATLERERIRRFGLALDKLAIDPDETARIDRLNAAVHDAGLLARPALDDDLGEPGPEERERLTDDTSGASYTAPPSSPEERLTPEMVALRKEELRHYERREMWAREDERERTRQGFQDQAEHRETELELRRLQLAEVAVHRSIEAGGVTPISLRLGNSVSVDIPSPQVAAEPPHSRRLTWIGNETVALIVIILNTLLVLAGMLTGSPLTLALVASFILNGTVLTLMGVVRSLWKTRRSRLRDAERAEP